MDNYTYLCIYDTKTTSSGISYYFKGSILSGNNYAVIKYSGRYSSVIIKARGSFINFGEEITVNSYNETILSPTLNADNYFYMEMHFPKYNYLYFYISNQNGILKRPIYYCIISNNPREYSPGNSCFKSLY